MAEPTTTAGLIVGAISMATLALLGVDYYSLLWALVGALLALYQSESMGKVRTVIFILLSTLIGAACGTGALAFVNSESRPLLILASLVAGYGAQIVVTALLNAGVKRIEKLGGQ